MIHYLVGRAVKSIAIQTLVEFLPRTTLAPAELRPFLDALGDYPANRQGIRDALCAEFVIRTSALEAMAAGRLDSLRENDVEGELMEAPARDGHKHPGHGLERAGEELLEVVALATPILLPQASRRLLAEQVRRFIRDVGRPLPERERMDPGARHDVVPDESLTVNAGGRSVLLLALEDFQRFVTDADVEDARVRGVQVLIALRSFQIETGRLPRLLDELVPRHLTAVPLDPFDGKPLRYSAEKRIVYSVGRDLTDDGGSEEQDPASASDDEDEPTFRIDF
jgi:hypothetical protein